MRLVEDSLVPIEILISSYYKSESKTSTSFSCYNFLYSIFRTRVKVRMTRSCGHTAGHIKMTQSQVT